MSRQNLGHLFRVITVDLTSQKDISVGRENLHFAKFTESGVERQTHTSLQFFVHRCIRLRGEGDSFEPFPNAWARTVPVAS